jgi:hypothetical protein
MWHCLTCQTWAIEKVEIAYAGVVAVVVAGLVVAGVLEEDETELLELEAELALELLAADELDPDAEEPPEAELPPPFKQLVSAVTYLN